PSSCFCFPLRRASRSTLFPYTTLFRSQDTFSFSPPQSDQGQMNPNLRRKISSFSHWAQSLESKLDQSHPHEKCSQDSISGHSQTDRKSTRLNSSHVKISYAVFCLKKKK